MEKFKVVIVNAKGEKVESTLEAENIYKGEKQIKNNLKQGERFLCIALIYQ